MCRGLVVRFLVVVAVLLVGAPAASASGRRGMVLTEKAIDGFRLVTWKEASKGLHYVGSTAKWHAFMRVTTSTGGGMPFDHLETFRIPVADVTIANGWTIRFSDRVIQANGCPATRSTAGGKLSIPAGPQIRADCGT